MLFAWQNADPWPLTLNCYSQRPFPFEQGRMRIVKAAVERVWGKIAQVLFVQFAQCMNERLRLSHCRTRERICLVFEAARPDVKERRKPETYRPRQPRDRGERHKNASDGNAEQLNYVALFIMANLMREHGLQLWVGELRDESIEQDDFSKTPEPGKEGVGMARAFAPIHHFDAARGKVGALCQCKEALAQCSFRQRCELVEKRHDDRGRNEQYK